MIVNLVLEMMASSDTLPNDSGHAAVSHSLAMITALAEICENNCKYFKWDESEAGQRFYCAFRSILDHIPFARTNVNELATFMHEYDFDESVPANGYRSMFKILQACVSHALKTSKYIAQNRGYLLFRKKTYMK